MSYQNILVPIDGSEISLSAAKHAAEIAKALGSQLTAISIVSEDPFSAADFYYSPDMLKDYILEAYKSAEEALEKVKTIGSEVGISINTQVIKGPVFAETISETAEKLGTDLIVMGSHGRKGFKKFLLGSFAQDVLGNTHIPVLVIKQ
ncbi:universal stress protein [Acinetobacter sp. ANC 4648]|uniref:universal stress protein n=1 Tax=Acinetobacter sp. ANC 4648 TaxID=1977875 RepID=UPI000A3505C8|nr:universal stress protein [Acinetobacter sp. ANC 4648]OTG82843.1 universal stress protein [Acinetobacter sp. ANC 4648]